MDEVLKEAATHRTTATGPAPGGAAARYADALFELAQDNGALESVEADLIALEELINASSDLRSLLTSPVYDADQKSAAIAAVAARAALGDLTTNFLGLVARNRRLFALDGMIAAFRALMSAHRGEVAAEATSAAPLNEEQTKRLRGEIERYVGKAVTLTTKVDAELLGGIVVKVGSTMVDTSLRSKLNRLRTTLKEA